MFWHLYPFFKEYTVATVTNRGTMMATDTTAGHGKESSPTEVGKYSFNHFGQASIQSDSPLPVFGVVVGKRSGMMVSVDISDTSVV